MSTGKYDAVMATSYVAPPVITLNAYDATTSVIIDLRGYKEKNILVMNTGLANGLTWNILASIDDGKNYDVALKANANVAFSAQELYSSSVYYTHWMVQIKSQASGFPTTAQVKLCAIGA